MTTALVLFAALVLGVLGLWATARLLGLLRLAPAERLALALALVPAILGLAAFGGLLVGQPGPRWPVAFCLLLLALGVATLALTPNPLTNDGAPPLRRDPRVSRKRERGRGGEGRHLIPVAVGTLQHESAETASSPCHPEQSEPASGAEGSQASVRPIREILRCAQDDIGKSIGKAVGRGGDGAGGTAGRGGSGAAVPVVVGTLLFTAGTVGTMLLTPLSAGALRIGDWVAHWFLVLVYLGQKLPDLRTFTNRVGNFGVISRPPLYNLEGGLLVGALDYQFWPFQLMTPLLALAVAAAGVLWAGAVGGRRAAWVTAGLIGLSPFLIQNSTYPWSKMVAAGQVLLFLYLIRAAMLARDRGRSQQAFVLAAVCAGLGYLAHQTTLFYALPALAWLVWRRPRPLFRRPATWSLTTWALGGLAGVLVVAPWQGWVLHTYGLSALLDANPASFGVDVSETFADWLIKGGVAAIGTLVPLPALGAIAGGAWPSVDQVLRFQLAVLTGALGFACCWLLVRAAPGSWRRLIGRTAGADAGRQAAGTDVGRRLRTGALRLLRRPPWLALVLLTGFLGQVMLQPNWHDTGDAAESMTPIVVLGLAYAAREALRLGRRGRWLFVAVVLAECLFYLGLWLFWAFSPIWTRDLNAPLSTRYELHHVRHLWGPAVTVGAVLVATGLVGSLLVLCRALLWPDARSAPVPVGPTAERAATAQGRAG